MCTCITWYRLRSMLWLVCRYDSAQTAAEMYIVLVHGYECCVFVGSNPTHGSQFFIEKMTVSGKLYYLMCCLVSLSISVSRTTYMNMVEEMSLTAVKYNLLSYRWGWGEGRGCIARTLGHQIRRGRWGWHRRWAISRPLSWRRPCTIGEVELTVSIAAWSCVITTYTREIKMTRDRVKMYINMYICLINGDVTFRTRYVHVHVCVCILEVAIQSNMSANGCLGWHNYFIGCSCVNRIQAGASTPTCI